jgi:hypothetical protein
MNCLKIKDDSAIPTRQYVRVIVFVVKQPTSFKKHLVLMPTYKRLLKGSQCREQRLSFCVISIEIGIKILGDQA